MGSASELHRIQRLPDSPHVSPEYGRLTLALLLSLLMHTLLLSLTFGGQGLWLRASASPGRLDGSRHPICAS